MGLSRGAAERREAFLHARETVACERRDFREWHRGRKEYGIWAIDLDTEPARAAVASARDTLSDYLMEAYRRQPHLTLHACGFPTDAGDAPGDCHRESIDRQARAVAAGGIRPFKIFLGPLDSFASSPHFRIHGGGSKLARLRRILSSIAPEDRGASYVPHMTVGLYAGMFPTASVIRTMREARGHPDISWLVREVCFMTYDPADIAGPLAIRMRVPLRGPVERSY